MPRLVIAAALLLTLAAPAADLRFESAVGGGWRAVVDGKPAEQIDASALAVVTQVPRDWREPIRAVRRAPASETGKLLYIAFLKRRYGYRISAVNDAYGFEAAAFTELESADFAGLDEKRAAVLVDDIAFAAEFYTEAAASASGPARRLPRAISLVQTQNPPLALIQELAGVADVDVIILRDAPNQTFRKPIVLAACPAVKPRFVAACLRI